MNRTRAVADQASHVTGSIRRGWIALAFALVASPVQAQTGTLSPATIAFGNQTVTTTSAAQNVTIANTHASASFQVTALTNSNAARFPIVGGTCGALPFTVAAGTSCTLGIAFAPNAVGFTSSTLSISGVTPSTTFTPASVALNGVGRPVPAVFAPDSLAFAETPAGVTSAPQTIAIGNADAQASLTISNYAISNPTRFLVVAGGTCPEPPFPIAPGGMCTVSIAFRGVLPVGFVSGSFGVATTPTSSFTPTTVGLSGIGGPDNVFSNGFE